jgi:cytochrome c553
MMIVFLIRSLAMKSLFTALSAGIVLVAVSGVATAKEPADPQPGFEYAQTYCATCHGISEEKSPLPQAPRFRHVADTTGMTATALQVWMQTSHPTMPNIIVRRATCAT